MRSATWSDRDHVYESMSRRGTNLTKRYWMFLTICQATSSPRVPVDSVARTRHFDLRPEPTVIPSIEQ